MILHGALLGCGHVSQFHLRAWAQIEGVEIVALANRTASKAEARAREFGIPLKHTYSDHRELLEKEDVDFVDIATAPHIHRQQVEAATARGRQVLCQKPFAPTLEDARAMLAACDRVERLTLEGDKGTVELIPGQPAILRVTTARETWQRPAFDVTPEEAYQASYTAAQRHFIECLRDGRSPETVVSDNYRTLAAAMAAYESAAQNQVVFLEDANGWRT